MYFNTLKCIKLTWSESSDSVLNETPDKIRLGSDVSVSRHPANINFNFFFKLLRKNLIRSEKCFEVIQDALQAFFFSFYLFFFSFIQAKKKWFGETGAELKIKCLNYRRREEWKCKGKPGKWMTILMDTTHKRKKVYLENWCREMKEEKENKSFAKCSVSNLERKGGWFVRKISRLVARLIKFRTRLEEKRFNLNVLVMNLE